MLSFKKILCPTDFSDPSNKALIEACELAAHYKSELVILHVLQPIQPIYGESPYPEVIAFDIVGYEKEEVGKTRESLKQLIEKYVPASVTAVPIIEVGKAADSIVEVAKRENVDLIVTATHGLTGWRRHVLGSVAEKVIRYSQCPVLTIREFSNGGN
jgi:universal stress protein A